jgi:hypothetical protein
MNFQPRNPFQPYQSGEEGLEDETVVAKIATNEPSESGH